MQIFKEFPQCQTNKHSTTTFKLKMSFKKKKKVNSLAFLWRKTALGWWLGDGAWHIWHDMYQNGAICLPDKEEIPWTFAHCLVLFDKKRKDVYFHNSNLMCSLIFWNVSRHFCFRFFNRCSVAFRLWNCRNPTKHIHFFSFRNNKEGCSTLTKHTSEQMRVT